MVTAIWPNAPLDKFARFAILAGLDADAKVFIPAITFHGISNI